ncbi:hypothetical protein DEA8626_03608 [Defluviimonas aquaemixtae]|uniref:HTH luxR-type domain-containing protein n=1 Tax=Albidovulum aquaemixtae TaxID=1542388 RepID=A0A2R8BMC1_9RHOB|nr:hypothetical protein [Defluviimonas aquaemixtae]SPH24556.1 hypothetical protein DEA8626_03608 [Defluviimonas aquaemixtae]
MSKPMILAVVAAVLFIGLAVVEQVRSSEPFTLIGLILDVMETGLLAGAIILAAKVQIDFRDLRRERRDLLSDLQHARREGDQWRAQARSHVEGLSRAIVAQFRHWELTDAEADVAALMLKGLSHKEIATLRESGEATVRQQAAVVYRKSGLGSRAQLTGYFLEDLLAPVAERSADHRHFDVVSSRTEDGAG